MSEYIVENYLGALKTHARGEGKDVLQVSDYLLGDNRFPYWSGSSIKGQHHYGKGGLIVHTLEVVRLCFASIHCLREYEVDTTELFLAALFHDAGKLYDYEPVVRGYPDAPEYSEWVSTPHKRYIHHISRSALMWSEASKIVPSIQSKYHDSVLHAILAHHTSREAGSPVAPKSRVAWLITLCDNMSARMNDADTWDIIKGAVK